MANWCETYLTFQSNGSEAGNQALADFHNKLSCIASNTKCIDLEGHWINTLWEQDIEDYIMSKIDSLKGKSINASKRGYIGYITDINYHTFHVVCYDAWVPNVDFWYILTTALYPEGLIEILYQATEPGCDIFLTNDRGLLPRYHMNVSIEGVTNLLNFPGMFNQQLSYGPFMYLANQDAIQIYHDYKCDYANKKVLHKFDEIEYCQDFEGDEDDILDQFEESGLGWFKSLNHAIESLNANGAEILQDEYEFEDIQPNQAFFIDKKSEED
jgi:hypothetical protein